MISLKSLIVEDKQLNTATTVRNAIIKSLQGVGIKAFAVSARFRFASSNPYSNRQTLEINTKKIKDRDKLIDVIESLGFSIDEDWKSKEHYDFCSLKNDQFVSVIVSYRKTEQSASIDVIGPKKAKRSSIPYYD